MKLKNKLIKSLIIITFIMLINYIRIPFKFDKNVYAAENASYTEIKDGDYYIASKLNDNKILTIDNGSKDSGTNIVLWGNSNMPYQKFTIKKLDNGYYTIISKYTNQSLDIYHASMESGINIKQSIFSGGEAQQWIIKDAGDGYYFIVSKLNSLNLDVYHADYTNGTILKTGIPSNSSAQKFKFCSIEDENKKIEDGNYSISSALDNSKVLDIDRASKLSGANLQIWTNVNQKQQQFKVTYLDNGYYSIIATHSNMALDVYHASPYSGANVAQSIYTGGQAQQWLIKDAGDGYYYIISKCNGLMLDVYHADSNNGANVETSDYSGSKAQKFQFTKATETEEYVTGEKTINNGTYIIYTKLGNNLVLDVNGACMESGGNVQVWNNEFQKQQQFKVTYLENGAYSIIATHSNMSLDVYHAEKINRTNVEQGNYTSSYAQQWIIKKDITDDYYTITSKCNNLNLDVDGAIAKNGTNVQVYEQNNTDAQKFKFVDIETALRNIDLDALKYPSYKEKIQALKVKHPNWNFKFLYTGITFANAVNGEASVPARNLVPTSYAGEWINGYTQYDSGWYAASAKAIAYYMDPRNFLDDVNIFQFLDENGYPSEISVSNIQTEVNNTYLSNYANDIYTACKNQGVNPYYIISRLIQEQGKNGTTIGKGMDGGDGYTYYNPFDIGASGNGYSEIYANALARAKSEGWNTMEKAIEGGITYCKKNWLDNYQNTLYQNRFDIDSTNGTSLYSHQYMQNLMGAYSEARLLKGMYNDTGCVDSTLTFIIPLYENMDSTVSPLPSSEVESYPMDFETTGTGVRLRESPKGNIICELAEKGTKLISAQRGVSSDWQKVITTDGKIGYVSCSYLTSIDTQTNCNHGATVKTNDGKGCNVRVGPSTRTDQLTAISDGASVTVINEGTYNNIDGYNWSRVVLASGAQGFMPSQYLK